MGAGTPRPVAVEARGWGWRHAGRKAWALRGVDLSVAPGERVLVLGPSGAGKSTLLAALAGVLDPSTGEEQEGELLLDGVPAREARGRAGLLMQDPQAQLVMARAGDDVAFGLENTAVPAGLIWPRVDAALEAVGFPYGRDRPTAALSGGEAQRLALAGAVAMEPGLLLLDEPTANLDPEGADLVRAGVRRVLDATGPSLLVVEHRVAPWLPLVDRVVVLAPGGGVLADGPPSRVLTGSVGSALAADGVWVPGREPAPPPRTPAQPGDELVRAAAVTHRHSPGAPPRPDRVDLALREGEAVSVTGRNGAGKTTLSLVLGGLLRPSAGSVTAAPALSADRRPLWKWRAAALASRVGTVFQQPERQFLTGRVRDEVALGPRRAGVPAQEADARADELLDRLGLLRLARANPHTLSGGEQRRLSVATTLAAAPRVLVLDEPTFGQDARTWAELVALLRGLLDAGTAVCAVTHDRAFVDALAGREVRLP
ncbi:ABC transporter ATP-binding protein [Motilibacter aurantiacus]|uniref:ABC transporter ATP-binding protein n=1 Tax=Motilibacter aurantiacus TaxID=2714955 RepID=UPI00140AFC24|nr:ABC transporter ATP-binding protein [Motilibacter aurantiacus]NHC45719.1 ABC transporter ATP-binding protein [Motilibacter aurantiacus]